MATIRAGMMTIGQIAMYDVFKELFTEKFGFSDNIATHLLCSSFAGICGAAYTMPLDQICEKNLQISEL